MTTLTIKDQLKWSNGSYIDYLHFAEGCAFLENGKYTGKVTINLEGGRDMEDLDSGMNFAAKELQKCHFANISQLVVNIVSYSRYGVLSTLQGICQDVSCLKNLNYFELNLERHLIRYHETFINEITSLLESKSLTQINLTFQNDIRKNETLLFTCYIDRDSQSLDISLIDFKLKANIMLVEYLSKMQDIKHLTYNPKFKLKQEKHDKYIESLIDLISSLSTSSIINLNLTFDNDRTYEPICFSSYCDRDSNDLTVSSQNFDLYQNSKLVKCLGQINNIKHFSYTQNDDSISSDLDVNDYNISFLKHFIEGNKESKSVGGMISITYTISKCNFENKDNQLPYPKRLAILRNQLIRENRYLSQLKLN